MTVPDTLAGAPLAGLGLPTHFGLVVPDREQAIAELEPVYGQFVRMPPREGGTHTLVGGSRMTVRLIVAWTLAGPVHVELIQAVPGTVWLPRPTGYLHHIAYRVDDVEAVSERLVEAGMTVEVTRWSESGRPTGFAYHTLPGGFRVELADHGAPEVLGALAAEQRG